MDRIDPNKPYLYSVLGVWRCGLLRNGCYEYGFNWATGYTPLEAYNNYMFLYSELDNPSDRPDIRMSDEYVAAFIDSIKIEAASGPKRPTISAHESRQILDVIQLTK